jgi:hypothetical protein
VIDLKLGKFSIRIYSSTQGDGKFTSKYGGLCRRFWRHFSPRCPRSTPGHSLYSIRILVWRRFEPHMICFAPTSVGFLRNRIRRFPKLSSSLPKTADLKNIMALPTCLAAAMPLSLKSNLCLQLSAVRANGATIVLQTALVLVVPPAGSLHPSVTYPTAEPSTQLTSSRVEPLSSLSSLLGISRPLNLTSSPLSDWCLGVPRGA